MKSKELYSKIGQIKEEARTLLDNGKISESRLKANEAIPLQKELEIALEKESKEIEELRKSGVKMKSDGRISNSIKSMKDNNIILPGETFEERNSPTEKANLSFAKLVKGMAGKGWEGAEEERDYMGSMLSMNNQSVIPVELANELIDRARANSAILGRIPSCPIDSNNLRIAIVKKDATARFVVEGDKIPRSETVLGEVTMEGKTLAMFIPISEQLIDSASNLEIVLQEIAAKAIAVALDEAILYGKGVVLDENGNKVKDEIKGISLYDNINIVEHLEEKNYDMILKGAKACRNNNTIPTSMVYSTSTGIELASIKDSTGRYIEQPKTLEKISTTESNNVKDNELYVYDFRSLLLGIHKGITAEWGTSEDDFGRLMKGLRVYLRADLAVINEKGITKVITQS
ncbi:MAG: phage major capsid protein [Clostridium sp.]